MTLEGTTTLLAGPERIEQRTYPLPDPGPGEVLVETVRANICGSELHIWRGHHPVVGGQARAGRRPGLRRRTPGRG